MSRSVERSTGDYVARVGSPSSPGRAQAAKGPKVTCRARLRRCQQRGRKFFRHLQSTVNMLMTFIQEIQHIITESGV